MPKWFAKISVNEIRAMDLVPPGDAKSVDPFLKFNFGGDFRLFRTQYKSKEANPSWDFHTDFFYNTAFPEKLNMKYIVVECWSHQTFGSDLFIGQAMVDLFTCATGPINHQLNLKNEAKQVTGKVAFELEVNEQVKDFTFAFKDVSINGLASQPTEGLVYLEYQFSEDLTKSITSSKVSSRVASAGGAIAWNSLDPVSLNTLMTTLIEEKSTVNFKLWMEKGGESVQLGSCQLEVLPLYSLDESPVTFKNAPLLSTGGQSTGLSLSGTVLSEKGPIFAQMRGAPDVAMHTDAGIFFSGKLLDGFPIPEKWKPSAVNFNTSPAAAASAAAAPAGSAVDVKAVVTTPTQSDVPAVRSSAMFVPAGGAGHQFLFPTSPNAAVGGPPSPLPVQQPLSFVPLAAAPTPAVKKTVSLKILTPEPRKKVPEDDLAPLPRHWSSKTDAKNQIYFRYTPTRKTTWLDPRFLPQGWEQRITEKGEVYFARSSARLTCWEDPRGMPPKWEVECDPKTHALVFIQGTNQTPVDPRGLPPGYVQSIDPQRGRLYYSNHIKHSTQWNDPRGTLSFDEQKALMKAERALWFTARLKEAKKTDDEQREFDLQWNLKRDDLDESFKRWLKQRTAEYNELKRFRDEDDAAAVAKIDIELKVCDAKFENEIKELEDEYRRMLQIKKAEAELKHFQDRKKVDVGLQVFRDKVRTDRSLYDAEMDAKRAKEVDARNDKLKADREALAREENEAREKKQAAATQKEQVVNTQEVNWSAFKVVNADPAPAAATAPGGGNTLPRGFVMPTGQSSAAPVLTPTAIAGGGQQFSFVPNAGAQQQVVYVDANGQPIMPHTPMAYQPQPQQMVWNGVAMVPAQPQYVQPQMVLQASGTQNPMYGYAPH